MSVYIRLSGPQRTIQYSKKTYVFWRIGVTPSSLTQPAQPFQCCFFWRAGLDMNLSIFATLYCFVEVLLLMFDVYVRLILSLLLPNLSFLLSLLGYYFWRKNKNSNFFHNLKNSPQFSGSRKNLGK